MGAFKLDTSGHVNKPDGGAMTDPPAFIWRWPDLSPFEQGYVEAMFASLDRENDQSILRRPSTGKIGSGLAKFVGFSDLAPETVATILKDCNAFVSQFIKIEDERVAGARFFAQRQDGRLTYARFPPLTPYLSDDGKVHLREGVSGLGQDGAK